ncbi:MAG TPA: hypothetical protein VGJ92_03500 [Methanocella sp.]|jgi:hypothetical protein
MIFSTMRKPLAFLVASLLIALLFVAMAAGTASAKDIVTIPLDRHIEVTPGMFAYLIQVTISDTTYGASYAQDPSKVIFPVLVYTYENKGAVAQNGHLHVKFVDDQGNSYDGSDAGTMDPVRPGNTSSTRIIEVNIPKDRKVTELHIVMGFDEQTIMLNYPSTPTPAATQGATGTASASPKGNFCISTVLLPLILVGATWLGKRAIKK